MIYEEINKHTGVRNYYSSLELVERLKRLGLPIADSLRSIDADTPIETRHQIIRKERANG
jgi:hypothetical protein